MYIYIYICIFSVSKCFVKKKGVNDGFKIIYTVTLSCFIGSEHHNFGVALIKDRPP